jgi:hypothetical protein
MKKLLAPSIILSLLILASIFSTPHSTAQEQSQAEIQKSSESVNAKLPDYDIRLAGKDGFADVDLSSTAGTQRALQSGDAGNQARARAVDKFRAGLSAEAAQNLRAQMNEAGAMKAFFIEGASLSEPQSEAPDKVARGFLKRQAELFALTASGIDSLKLEREDPDQGTTFLEYSQRVGGIKVYDGSVKVVVNNEGEVTNVREGFLISGQEVKLNATLSEQQGIARAFEHAGRAGVTSFVQTVGRETAGEYSRFTNPLNKNYEEVLSELNVVRVGNEARLAWHVYAEVGPEEWYELLVDAHNGELLLRHNLYVDVAQGTVYIEDPLKGARQLVSFVGNTTINTTAGWMGTSTVTTGNNVEAYLDSDADNLPDPNNSSELFNGHAFAADQNFTFAFSTTVDPRTQQAAVVTNLFYYNNFMHDFSYGLGFTETAGNFQTNNYGRGGLGNDSVMAEAQDGSGTNNANFATPPDGQRPRMQQYLFTAPNPDRDSSVDSDVVFHEYGHGISNRLIGNGSSTALAGIQSGAMGEGWSDYWAFTINGDGAIAEYSTDDPTGIRRAPYTVPAATVHDSYADVCVNGCEVHRDGEVWAATLWDLRAQLGAQVTDRLVLNGMKFTPTRPSFINARDGILQADQNLNGGANRCAIWTVFARHGMGVSASGSDGMTHTASPGVPSDCGGSGICDKATMTSPASQATLNSTQTFTWNNSAGEQYWLYVGYTQGSVDIYSQDQGTATSATVAGIPKDGRIIWVRLWTRCASTWYFNDYIYNSGNVATMISPANGATIPTTQTFTWTNVGAAQYWLYMGDKQGTAEYLSQDQGTATSRTFSDIPRGRTIWIRLWTRFGSNWGYKDYSYNVVGCSASTMTSPTNGAAINPTQTFTWNNSNGDQYWLYVGNTQGSVDIYNQNQGTATSVTVSGIPTDGRTIWVRLWTRCDSTWSFNDYSYNGQSVKATMITPANGAATGSTQSFTWTNAGAEQYWLYVGNTQGSVDVYNQDQGTATSATVSGIPTDGRTIWVRLWTRFGSTWDFNDYNYTTAACGNASMVSPANGARLSTTQTFAWTNAGAEQYWLYVGNTQGSVDVYNQDQGTATSATVSGIPTDGRTIWVRLWSRCGSTWSFNDYSYNAGGTSAAFTQLTAPPRGALFGFPLAAFNWKSGGATGYRMCIGNSPGASDSYSADPGT